MKRFTVFGSICTENRDLKFLKAKLEMKFSENFTKFEENFRTFYLKCGHCW